jgi:hypothetical protein
MAELAEQWIADHHPGQMADPSAYAALLVAMEVGVLSMRQQLSRALGADILTPAGHLRLARAKLDFYSQPLLSAGLAAEAHAAIAQFEARLAATAAAAPPATASSGS